MVDFHICNTNTTLLHQREINLLTEYPQQRNNCLVFSEGTMQIYTHHKTIERLKIPLVIRAESIHSLRKQ